VEVFYYVEKNKTVNNNDHNHAWHGCRMYCGYLYSAVLLRYTGMDRICIAYAYKCDNRLSMRLSAQMLLSQAQIHTPYGSGLLDHLCHSYGTDKNRRVEKYFRAFDHTFAHNVFSKRFSLKKGVFRLILL